MGRPAATTFLAALALALPAGAQDDPLLGGATSGIIQRELRVMIELVSVYAVIETGWEDFGSDEIAVVAEVGDHVLRGPTLGGMDKGDVEAVPADRGCLWVAGDATGSDNGRWGCRASGGGLPVTLTLSVYDIDSDWQGFFGAFVGQPSGFCADNATTLTGDLGDGQCLLSNPRTESADLVGRHRLTYTAEDVRAALPRPGDSRSESVSVNRCSTILTVEGGICGGGGPFENWSGWYELELRVTRLPDVVVEPEFDPDP